MSGDAQSAWVEVLEHGKTPWNSKFLTMDIAICPANGRGLLRLVLYLGISHYAKSCRLFQGGAAGEIEADMPP